MPENKILLMLASQRQMSWLGHRLRPLGWLLAKANPRLGPVLPKLRMDAEPEGYALGSFASSFIYGLALFLLSVIVLWARYQDLEQVWLPSLVIGFSFWALFFLFHMAYPGIIVRKIAAK